MQTHSGDLPGVRAKRFVARSRQLHDDPLAVVLGQATAWILEHREDACPMRVEFEQWHDDSELRDLTAAERLLATIFSRDDGRGTTWNAEALVYFETSDESIVPHAVEWIDVEP